MTGSSDENWRESLRFYALALITVVTLSVVLVVTLESNEAKLPPFCPINGSNEQFKQMVDTLWNAAGNSGYLCTNVTNIFVHFREFEVGLCQFDCNHHDWLKIGVKCPISLVGLKYTSNNVRFMTRTRCKKGNFTMTFFAQLGNIVHVSSIQVRDCGFHPENDERVNWLTYLARKGALATVNNLRKVGGNFQFVDDNEIQNEEPGKWCKTNPTCHERCVDSHK